MIVLGFGAIGLAFAIAIRNMNQWHSKGFDLKMWFSAHILLWLGLLSITAGIAQHLGQLFRTIIQ